MTGPAAAVAAADQTSVISDTVVSFFDALKAGDTDAIRQFAGGRILEGFNRKVDANANYHQFLKKRYANAVLEKVDLPSVRENSATADVRIAFGNHTPDLFKWILKKESDGRWYVVEEIK
jgi:hypothetical protein